MKWCNQTRMLEVKALPLAYCTVMMQEDAPPLPDKRMRSQILQWYGSIMKKEWYGSIVKKEWYGSIMKKEASWIHGGDKTWVCIYSASSSLV